MFLVLQRHLCHHMSAMAQSLQAAPSEMQDHQHGPIIIDPVDCAGHPGIFDISVHESPSSQLSFISTSPGRTSVHVFFVQETDCLVQVFRRHHKWRVQCMSSSKSHFGATAKCCKIVYEMIGASDTFTSRFDPILDPTHYVRIRNGFDKDEKYEPVQNWPSEAAAS